MKIDRRSFLSFMAGGMAGTALSPLPWKLMDDISIWSQNWPWIPVPKSGESTYIKSICSLCRGNCNIVIRKVDNRVIKIEGFDETVVNGSKICSLGLSGLQLLYGSTRIKTPMKRVGSRGSGRWEKISWENAISIVAKELNKIKSDGDTEDVACISGFSNGSVDLLLKRFFKAYGSSKCFSVSSDNDISELVFQEICGKNVNIRVDLLNSDLILNFGGDLSSITGMINFDPSLIRNNVNVIQIEPNLTNTSAKAKEWVPINPGTEVDLSFGIISYMLKNGLYDSNILKEDNVLFQNWKEVILEKYSLDYVSKKTGIDVNIISKIAKLFFETPNAVAVFGRGNYNTFSSFKEHASVHFLNIIKGNINKKGGVFLYNKKSYFSWPLLHTDKIVNSDLENIDDVNLFNISSFFNEFIFSDISKKTSLKALFVANSNPLYCQSSFDLINKFKDIPFIVNFSSFMDETVIESDLILPDHIYLEKCEDIFDFSNVSKDYIGFSKPVVSPLFNTRHIGDSIINIAQKIGGNLSNSFPWSNYDECLNEILKNHNNCMGLDEIWVSKERKKVELEEISFIDTSYSNIKIDGDKNEFPFVLIPSNVFSLSDTYFASPPFLMKIVEDTLFDGKNSYVSVNSKTAKVFGFTKNEKVILSTPRGRVMVRIHLCNGVRPGVLIMPKGLGHTAYDGYIADKGVNINDLIGPVKDPVIGHDAFWGIRAKLTKI